MNAEECNRKIVEWLGWTYYNDFETTSGWYDQNEKTHKQLPDYYNSPNGEAFGLLDELVKRGYVVKLEKNLVKSYCTINSIASTSDGCPDKHYHRREYTLPTSIVTAVCDLIDKEQGK